MPIYEYGCSSCNEVFSLLQRVGASEKDSRCPKCGSADVRKKVSAFCCSSSSAGAGSSFGSAGFSGGGGGG